MKKKNKKTIVEESSKQELSSINPFTSLDLKENMDNNNFMNSSKKDLMSGVNNSQSNKGVFLSLKRENLDSYNSKEEEDDDIKVETLPKLK